MVGSNSLSYRGFERIHLLLLEDARRGLEDIFAGRTQEANAAIARMQRRRSAASKSTKSASKRG
jgi:hypothetical protein